MAFPTKALKEFAVRAATENLGLKTVALVVTVGLFVLVRFQERVDSWVDVEVAVMRPDVKSGLVVTSDVPDKVRVTLRGRSSVVKAVKSGDVGQVVMDLSTRRAAGSFLFSFDPEMFDFPSGVEILHINPESVQVRVEKIVTRRVPVNVRTVGRPRSGLELAEPPIAVPPEATISGPSSVVNGIGGLDTEDLDVSALDVGRHEVRMALRRVGGVLVKYVDKLAVVVELRYTPGQRSIEALPLAVRVGTVTLEDGVDVRPKTVAATLRGPKFALDALDPAMVRALTKVDSAAALRGGVMTGSVELEGLPPHVEVESLSPETVKVRWNTAAVAAIKAKLGGVSKGSAGRN